MLALRNIAAAMGVIAFGTALLLPGISFSQSLMAQRSPAQTPSATSRIHPESPLPRTPGLGHSPFPLSNPMAELGDSRMPIGWHDFCSRYSGDCRVPSLGPAAIALTAKTWKTLVTINDHVNRTVEPVTDQEHWGVAERWDYPTDGKGDCEDYALEKRRLLIQAGLPRQALLMTVVRDKKGDGHAVLTVVTDRGDYVLDNQEASVLAWDTTGYRFVKRQGRDNPNHWIALGDVATPMTAAR